MLLRSQVEEVLSEAIRSTGGLRPDYHSRIRVEAISQLLPFLPRGPLVSWWLETLRYWDGEMNPNEVLDTIDLLLEKNRIYGSKQLYAFGSFGILIRSYDKMERIRNIDSGVTNKLMVVESRRDSVQDLFAYAILAILVLRKEL